MEESANDKTIESETIDEDLNDTKQIIIVLKAINRNLFEINRSLKTMISMNMMKK